MNGEIWALTMMCTSDHDFDDDEHGLTILGLFSSVENCKHYLVKCYFGQERFDEFQWEQAHAGFVEAHDPGHIVCFALTREEVDRGLRSAGTLVDTGSPVGSA